MLDRREPIEFSKHARSRMCERHVTKSQVYEIYRYGEVVHDGDRLVFCVEEPVIGQPAPSQERYDILGVHVVVDARWSNPIVVTVYRDERTRPSLTALRNVEPIQFRLVDACGGSLLFSILQASVDRKAAKSWRPS